MSTKVSHHGMARAKAIDYLLADELIRLPDPGIARNGPEQFVQADLMRYLDD